MTLGKSPYSSRLIFPICYLANDCRTSCEDRINLFLTVQLGVVGHTCNPSTQEAEVEVQKFEAS
jgi:hypothetical protein